MFNRHFRGGPRLRCAVEIKTLAQAARSGGGRPAVRPVLPPGLRYLGNVDSTLLGESAGAACDAVLHFAMTTTNPRLT